MELPAVRMPIRQAMLRGLVAPSRSWATRAHRRRVARNLAIVSKKYDSPLMGPPAHQAPGRTELGDRLEEIRLRAQGKHHGPELVERHASFRDGVPVVLPRVGDDEGHLLRGRDAGIPPVIATGRAGVPLGRVPDSELDEIEIHPARPG